MVLYEKRVGDKVFKLVQASIIEEPVDAIVNAANQHLAHGGGVAGLISRVGGPDIQRESNAKAPVPIGGATFTTAGKLPYKYIIHAVGPIYRGREEVESHLLQSAVASALALAEELKLVSLALPAISTGIFGYPLKPAIQIIVKAIIDFFETHPQSVLVDVRLCEFAGEKAREIKDIIIDAGF